MTTIKDNSLPSSNPDRELFMKKLMKHAKLAENFDNTVLKELKAVPSPNGGYRMEVRVIRGSTWKKDL